MVETRVKDSGSRWSIKDANHPSIKSRPEELLLRSFRLRSWRSSFLRRLRSVLYSLSWSSVSCSGWSCRVAASWSGVAAAWSWLAAGWSRSWLAASWSWCTSRSGLAWSRRCTRSWCGLAASCANNLALNGLHFDWLASNRLWAATTVSIGRTNQRHSREQRGQRNDLSHDFLLLEIVNTQLLNPRRTSRTRRLACLGYVGYVGWINSERTMSRLCGSVKRPAVTIFGVNQPSLPRGNDSSGHSVASRQSRRSGEIPHRRD